MRGNGGGQQKGSGPELTLWRPNTYKYVFNNVIIIIITILMIIIMIIMIMIVSIVMIIIMIK